MAADSGYVLSVENYRFNIRKWHGSHVNDESFHMEQVRDSNRIRSLQKTYYNEELSYYLPADKRMLGMDVNMFTSGYVSENASVELSDVKAVTRMPVFKAKTVNGSRSQAQKAGRKPKSYLFRKRAGNIKQRCIEPEAVFRQINTI